MGVPNCPITHEPASRLIQSVPASLLERVWKHVGRTDVSGLFSGINEFGLWEAPCGLAFFSPAIAGEDRFYRTFYGRFNAHKALKEVAPERPEYIAAAEHVAAGDRVLDVGAGCGGFRQHVEHSQFTGLDPYAEPDEQALGVIREDSQQHAASHAGYYDVVSAFQVIEHTTDPAAFASTLSQMVKPGGALILGVPLWPSPMIRCPNMLINCPPHHLTWWNEGSLEALASNLGLEVVEIKRLPPHRHHAWFHRMEQLTWVDMSEKYFANRASWHLNMAIALPLSLLWGRIAGLPQNAEPIDIMLVARKPAAKGKEPDA